MFQNLANYLLGSITNPNQGATAEGVEGSSNSIRLTSIETDDNWVLVDRDSEGNSDNSSIDSLEDEDLLDNETVPINNNEELHDKVEPNLPFSLFTRTSSTSSLPCMSNMEESWFLTPPPCFTSAGPIHMETSPLENLLIEHPSMSVYHQHRRYNGPLTAANNGVVRTSSPLSSRNGNAADDDVDDDEDDDLERVEVADVENHGEDERIAIVQQTPRVNNRLQVLQQQQRQCVKNKNAQKVGCFVDCLIEGATSKLLI